METERKKWNLNDHHHVHFYSPTDEFSNLSSDVDHENELTPNKPQKDACRTPLVQVNRDFEIDDFCRESMGLERHKRAKSCPSNKIRSAKKKLHDYYLRVTPSRLSRVIVQSQDDYDSDEYLDANEYIHDSSFDHMRDNYHLRNRSIARTSTVRPPFSTQHRGSQVEVHKSRRSSYIVEDSTLNDENTCPSMLQFPGNGLSLVADRRSSYIVTDSKLSASEIPHTPTLRKSPRVSGNVSKEDSFQKKYIIHKMSKNITKKNRNRKSNANAIHRRTTVFQPFKLKTNERCPKKDLSYSSQKEVDFTSTLRHNTPKGKAKSPTLTKCNPFHFNQPRKRQREEDDDGMDYQPLAERVAAHFKTPTRYRSVPRQTVFKPTGKRYSPHLVRPQTPNLQAMKRKRAVTVLSHEQKMDLEAKQIKEYQFHAKPYNPELANHPHVLKMEKKAPTKPEPVELETEKRMMTRKYFEKQTLEPKYEFHAQKIPKGILKGTVGLKNAKPLPVTHPKSPMFALKDRAEKWKAFCDMDTTSSSGVFHFKAKPAPIPKSPQFMKPTRRTTSFQPFSFDEQDTARKVKKQKKIQEEIEKENKKFEFHAQKMPSSIFTPRPIHKVEKKAPTIPQPFNLHGATSSRYSLRCNESVETTYIQNKPRFKAKPANVLKKEPFIPHKSLKPPIEFNEFNLNTENRAIAREQLMEERMSINLERELAAQRYMEEKEQKEKEELRELRKQLVHKAQPVRNYKPVHVKPSDKLPTDAQSPQFATNYRRRRSNSSLL